MLPLAACVALFVLSNGASAQSLSQAITNMSSATITYMGYNETGFMNTSEVSGPPDALPTSTAKVVRLSLLVLD